MPPPQSSSEELANRLTHGIAALLSIAGLVVMVVFASLRGTVWHVVSVSIYGASLILLFSASTLYHSLSTTRAQARLQVFDHASIFILIAGTYTPFMLGPLRGAWGWSLFGVVWGLALVGVIAKLFLTGRFQRLSTVIYLLMGWICVIAVKPMLSTIPAWGLGWLLAGGMFYSLGVIFYLGHRIPWNHAIWHLFVMAGSLCHFVSVLFFVIPPLEA